MKRVGEGLKVLFLPVLKAQNKLVALGGVWLVVVPVVLSIRLDEALKRALTSFGNGVLDDVTKQICHLEEVGINLKGQRIISGLYFNCHVFQYKKNSLGHVWQKHLEYILNLMGLILH